MEKLLKILDEIKPIDTELGKRAKERLDQLTKPKESLGRLEEFAEKIVSITGKLRPQITKKIIFTFAGDHGVAEEGVSAFPKEVTPQMVLNFLRGGAGVNALAMCAGAEVKVIDIGVDFDFNEEDSLHEKLIRRKIIRGTKNIIKGAAMTMDETLKCINVGIELATGFATEGAIFGTGEMGIANTTPSSAIAACFTGLEARKVTGRGTGIDGVSYNKKVGVIEEALRVNDANPKDPLSVLAKLGGAEIAGITGLIIGSAIAKVPVVIDGFISTAGALVATELCPRIKGYLFSAHRSVEQGHGAMLEKMNLRPFLNLDLRLGEGTGAVLGIQLLEAALSVYNNMASFEDAGVSRN
ncbi:MAG: nicotinate-nucleotide--dimethylbenzimidazole phosphoribosyltransferase [Deltaproteobacteria bacterium]|nr:nicotinate-nucleotide--dimethylbenzimidazole phosphoribosyltransferase [Deltaproteobacteria bacterium]